MEYVLAQKCSGIQSWLLVGSDVGLFDVDSTRPVFVCGYGSDPTQFKKYLM